MIHYIALNGVEWPICLSHALAYEYERTTGRFYEHDLRALFQDIVTEATAMGTDDAAAAAGKMSLVRFVDFFHAALRLGCRREKTLINFDEYDVADWLLSDNDAVARFTTLLLEANVDPNAKTDNDSTDGAKKKNLKKNPVKSTGRRS